MDSHQMAGHLIRRLHQKSTQVFQARARALGEDITQVQFAAMNALARHPDIDQARLAEVIGYDRATIGGVVERLEKKGLVDRRTSRQDRRARLVRLTDAGHRTFERLLPEVIAVQDGILTGLNAQEKDELHRLMAKALELDADGAT